MKSFLVVVCLLISSMYSIAQDKTGNVAWKAENSVVTIGYGVPNLYKAILKSAVRNAGVNSNYNNGSANESYNLNVTGFGPGFLKYDYAINELIGVGAVVGYWSTTLTNTHTYRESNYNYNTGLYNNADYVDIEKLRVSSLSIGARLNFHFATTKKLDPYAGFGAGYSNTSFRVTETSTNPNYRKNTDVAYGFSVPIYFAITAGVRYYFTDNIGIYGEFGIDKWSVLQGGLAIKF